MIILSETTGVRFVVIADNKGSRDTGICKDIRKLIESIFDHPVMANIASNTSTVTVKIIGQARSSATRPPISVGEQGLTGVKVNLQPFSAASSFRTAIINCSCVGHDELKIALDLVSSLIVRSESGWKFMTETTDQQTEEDIIEEKIEEIPMPLDTDESVGPTSSEVISPVCGMAIAEADVVPKQETADEKVNCDVEIGLCIEDLIETTGEGESFTARDVKNKVLDTFSVAPATKAVTSQLNSFLNEGKLSKQGRTCGVSYTPKVDKSVLEAECSECEAVTLFNQNRKLNPRRDRFRKVILELASSMEEFGWKEVDDATSGDESGELYGVKRTQVSSMAVFLEEGFICRTSRGKYKTSKVGEPEIIGQIIPDQVHTDIPDEPLAGAHVLSPEIRMAIIEEFVIELFDTKAEFGKDTCVGLDGLDLFFKVNKERALEIVPTHDEFIQICNKLVEKGRLLVVSGAEIAYSWRRPDCRPGGEPVRPANCGEESRLDVVAEPEISTAAERNMQSIAWLEADLSDTLNEREAKEEIIREHEVRVSGLLEEIKQLQVAKTSLQSEAEKLEAKTAQIEELLKMHKSLQL